MSWILCLESSGDETVRLPRQDKGRLGNEKRMAKGEGTKYRRRSGREDLKCGVMLQFMFPSLFMLTDLEDEKEQMMEGSVGSEVVGSLVSPVVNEAGIIVTRTPALGLTQVGSLSNE